MEIAPIERGITMSECYRDLYLENSDIKRSESFSDSMITEGISLYEVVRVIDGVPLFFEKHLERLKNSATLANLELWLSLEEIKAKMQTLMKVNNAETGNIKLVFNYGKEEPGSKNTFLTYFLKHHYPSEEQYKNGVPTVLCFMERNNPNAKIINTNLKSATDELMRKTGAYEAILVDKNNNITEGSRSNIFMVKKNTVVTAPLEDVLPGITREFIIEACSREKIKFTEERIKEQEIEKLDALFITGTSPKVLPINKVNDFPFSSSTNIIVQRIMNTYNRIIDEYVQSNKEKL
jgi:branched-chain amino acid aminotransferase